MKLTVIGGGGVRSPFLAKSIALGADKINVTEVVFFDNNEDKLHMFGGLSKMVSERCNPKLKFTLEVDPVKAFSQVDYVITTIRAGGDENRVEDERLALGYDVLGQETTGACGFAMAMRSIPALLEYCKIIEEVGSKDALIFNFTNPSGIVTQALHQAGYTNVYGICDAPSEFIAQIEKYVGGTKDNCHVTCFGINHFSWFKDITFQGKDVTEELLQDDEFYVKTDARTFSKELVAQNGNAVPNEYLQYYFYRTEKVNIIQSAPQTRGEQILEINTKMWNKLQEISLEENPMEAFSIFIEHYAMRENLYGTVESGKDRLEIMEPKSFDEFIDEPDKGGYAAVALNFIRAFVTGEKAEVVMSLPNKGALDFLEEEDIVEISCVITKDHVEPIKVENVANFQKVLISHMKQYEKAAATAILEKSKTKAIQALVINPLVNSYTIAEKLGSQFVDKYGKDWQK